MTDRAQTEFYSTTEGDLPKVICLHCVQIPQNFRSVYSEIVCARNVRGSNIGHPCLLAWSGIISTNICEKQHIATMCHKQAI